MIAVADVEIAVHRTCIEIDVKTEVRSGWHVPWRCQRIVQTGLYRSVIACRAVFFHHQVDNSGCTFGTELGGRVGDHFDLLDRSGRHLLQHLSAVLGVESGGLAVNPDLHIFTVAQRDRAFLIHIDGRNVLQHVGHGRTGRSDILIDGEDFLVQFKTHRTALSHYLHFAQCLCVFFELDAPDIKRFAGYGDLSPLFAIAHEGNDDGITSVREFQRECARRVGDRTGHQLF